MGRSLQQTAVSTNIKGRSFRRRRLYAGRLTDPTLQSALISRVQSSRRTETSSPTYVASFGARERPTQLTSSSQAPHLPVHLVGSDTNHFDRLLTKILACSGEYELCCSVPDQLPQGRHPRGRRDPHEPPGCGRLSSSRHYVFVTLSCFVYLKADPRPKASPPCSRRARSYSSPRLEDTTPMSGASFPDREPCHFLHMSTSLNNAPLQHAPYFKDHL